MTENPVINNPFDRLAKIFDLATDVKPSCMGYIGITKFATKYSAWGWVCRCIGYSDRQMKFGMTGLLLEKIGFSKRAIKQKRRCTEYGCKHITNLYGMIWHLTIVHGTTIKGCAEKVFEIKHDPRPIPDRIERFKVALSEIAELKFGKRGKPDDKMDIDFCARCGVKFEDDKRKTRNEHEKRFHKREYDEIRKKEWRDIGIGIAVFIIVASGIIFFISTNESLFKADNCDNDAQTLNNMLLNGNKTGALIAMQTLLKDDCKTSRMNFHYV